MLATASWSEIVPKHTNIFQVGKSFIPSTALLLPQGTHYTRYHKVPQGTHITPHGTPSAPQHPVTPQFPPMLGPKSPTTTFMVLPRHSSDPRPLPERHHPAVWGLPKFRQGTSKSQDGRILAELFSLDVLPYFNHGKEHRCDVRAASAQKSADKKKSFSHCISLPTNGSWSWIFF